MTNHLKLFANLSCLLAMGGPLHAGMITLTASGDAQIHSPSKDGNFDADLAIRQNQPVYTALAFDLSTVVGTITSAKLRVHWKPSTVAGVDIDVRRFDGPVWNESTVTWNSMNEGNNPINAAPNIVSSFSTPAGGNFTEIDLTGTVQFWHGNASDNRGLLFASTSGGSQAVGFFSRQQFASGTPAQLILQGEIADTSAVPEPSALVSVAVGIAGLLLYHSRRKSQSTALANQS